VRIVLEQGHEMDLAERRQPLLAEPPLDLADRRQHRRQRVRAGDGAGAAAEQDQADAAVGRRPAGRKRELDQAGDERTADHAGAEAADVADADDDGGGPGRVGLEALRSAVNLDPLNPRAHKSLALGLYAARDYAGSIDAMRRALALSPKMTLAHSVIGDALLVRGDAAGAEAEYRLEPVAWARLTGLAIAAARAGRKDEARTMLGQLVGQFGDSNVYQQAEVQAQLGDADRAVAALKRARNVGDVGLAYVWTDPLLDPLRQNEAFKSLIAPMA
jgi:tetratricopeptide (TPR) repeat protein